MPKNGKMERKMTHPIIKAVFEKLKSRPFAPHPLFVSFVKAAIDNSRLV